MNKHIEEIVEVIKQFRWNLTQVYVENNCIYAERICNNTGKVTEGLYAGSDFDKQDVYNVYHNLLKVLDFQGILKNDNIM